jgi:hypothetical protein
MMNQPKPRIDVMFSSQYPEGAKKDIHNLLEEKFKVNISERVSFRKDATIWIILTVALLGTALKVFLKEFMGESGKLLARRLFQARNQVDNASRPVNVQLVIVHSEREITITGKDEEELYQNLLEAKEELEKAIQDSE